VKALLKRVLFGTLANRALMKRWTSRLRAGSMLTILAFHRVAPPDGSAYAPLDPAMFDDALSFVTKNFDIITFAELKSYLIRTSSNMLCRSSSDTSSAVI
jgi:hypothetical protein